MTIHLGRRGSRILKWGVKFCNNVIEPKPGIRRKKKEKERRGIKKREGGENSPISPPLDPRLLGCDIADVNGSIGVEGTLRCRLR